MFSGGIVIILGMIVIVSDFCFNTANNHVVCHLGLLVICDDHVIPLFAAYI